MERATGIEPASGAWKAPVLPLNYARTREGYCTPLAIESGRDDRIRTCDILLPKQARYQTAPRPDTRLRLRGARATLKPNHYTTLSRESRKKQNSVDAAHITRSLFTRSLNLSAQLSGEVLEAYSCPRF